MCALRGGIDPAITRALARLDLQCPPKSIIEAAAQRGLVLLPQRTATEDELAQVAREKQRESMRRSNVKRREAFKAAGLTTEGKVRQRAHNRTGIPYAEDPARWKKIYRRNYYLEKVKPHREALRAAGLTVEGSPRQRAHNRTGIPRELYRRNYYLTVTKPKRHKDKSQ